MRPDMRDILGGIQRVLMEDVLPDLATDQGRERLASVLFLLQHAMARWEGVLPFMREEYADVRDVLGNIDAIGAGGEMSKEIAELMAGVKTLVAGDPGPDVPFEALGEALRARREVLSGLAKILAARDLDENSANGKIRREIYGYIRRQLPRNRAWVQVGEIVW